MQKVPQLTHVLLIKLVSQRIPPAGFELDLAITHVLFRHRNRLGIATHHSLAIIDQQARQAIVLAVMQHQDAIDALGDLIGRPAAHLPCLLNPR